MSSQTVLNLLPEKPLADTPFRAAEVSVHDLPDDILAPEPSREMIESVKKFGVLQPVILVEAEAGAGPPYEIEDGRGRILATLKTERGSVPAYIYPRAAFVAGVVTLNLNAQRRANPIAEVRIIQQMLSAGATTKEVCEAAGVVPAHIKKVQSLEMLIPPLREALEGRCMSVEAGFEAAKLDGEIQDRLVAVLNESGVVRVRDVREAKQARRKAAAEGVDWDELLDDSVAPRDPRHVALSHIDQIRGIISEIEVRDKDELLRVVEELARRIQPDAQANEQVEDRPDGGAAPTGEAAPDAGEAAVVPRKRGRPKKQVDPASG